jgi:MFS family permease
VRALETQSPSARAGSDRRLLAVLVLAVVGFAFQQTAIVPAVQTVQASLHGSKEWSAWLVTVYLIVATVATPAMGRLADLYGRRRLLVIGLVVFTLGSVAAAFAPNLPVLICCRAVQGVGGSVYPLCLAIAREQVPRERVTAAVAALTGAFGLGTAVGSSRVGCWRNTRPGGGSSWWARSWSPPGRSSSAASRPVAIAPAAPMTGPGQWCSQSPRSACSPR